VGRDNGRRRIVVSANVGDGELSDVVAQIRQVLAATPLPQGYATALEGQFQAQEEASRLIGLLALVSLLLIFLVLYSRYRSTRLALMIMAGFPWRWWVRWRPCGCSADPVGGGAGGLRTNHRNPTRRHPQDQPLLNLCAFEGETFGRLDRARLAGGSRRCS